MSVNGEGTGSTKAAKDVVDQLLSVWGKLKVNRLAEEERELLLAPITPEVVSECERRFRDAWQSKSPLRAVATRYGFLVNITAAGIIPEDVKIIEVNRFEGKEWFIPARTQSLWALADFYGKRFGDRETDIMFHEMSEKLVPTTAENQADLKKELDAFIDGVQPENLGFLIILCSIPFHLLTELHRSELFEYPRTSEERHLFADTYRGRYRKVPFLDIWLSEQSERRTLLCGDMSENAVIQQFNGGHVGHDLELSVAQIDDNQARELMVKHPFLRRSPEGRELSVEDAVVSLLKKVHLQIRERVFSKGCR